MNKPFDYDIMQFYANCQYKRAQDLYEQRELEKRDRELRAIRDARLSVGSLCWTELTDRLRHADSLLSLDELKDAHYVMTRLLESQPGDPELTEYLELATDKLRAKQLEEQKRIRELTLAEALMFFQNNHLNEVHYDDQLERSHFQELEETVPNSLSNLEEIAEALAHIQNDDQISQHDDTFIPMPPGWDTKEKDKTSSDYHLPWLKPRRLPPHFVQCDPTMIGDTRKAPGYKNGLVSPKFSRKCEPVSVIPETRKLPTLRQPPSPGQGYEFVPSPSEIGGDEFFEEEKSSEQNIPWKTVGRKPSRTPVTMAAVVKMSLFSESKQKPNNYGFGTDIPGMRSELVSPKARSVESNGTKSTEYWESSEEESEPHSDPLTDPRNPLQATSIWVGNLTPKIEKEMLYTHFKKIGFINNIIVTQENHCAFVNFDNPKAAGRAMRTLQGLVIDGVKLILRYPNRFLGGDHTHKLKDATAVIPGRPKRGNYAFQVTPKRPHKKGTK